MRRPVTTAIVASVAVLCAGLGFIFLSAYRKGITIHLGESSKPNLSPPPPAGSDRPSERPQPYTNEQLHTILQEETSQLGIQRFVPHGEHTEGPSEGFLGPSPGYPRFRARAETAIREIARLRRSVDSGKKTPVLLSGKTVQLLAEPESGGTSIEPVPKAGISHPEGASPPQTFAPGSWSGLYGGAEEGTLTISDAKTWANLWNGLSRQPSPALDFSQQQIVGVFIGPQPTGGFSVEITPAVTVLPTAVVVRYRVRSPAAGRTPPEGATSPYALRAIGRTDLPVRFEKQP